MRSHILESPFRRIWNKNAFTSVIILVVTFFWAIYANMSQYNLDMYQDMLENYSWGIQWQWGNKNHPPLFGWITALWFDVFPRSNISYRFLSSINIGASLVLMLMIARRFLDRDQQFAAIAVALVLPLLGFMALTYNANSAMLPFWAATFLFYIRLLERQRLVDALALALFAALAVLVKYYSFVLILSIFIHSVSDAAVRPLWRKPFPWAAALVCLLVLSPHVFWLFANEASSVRFAIEDQGRRDVGNILFREGEFFLAQIAYALPGLLVLALWRRPRERPAFDLAQFRSLAHSASGRALLAAGLLPIPVTMILSLAVWSPLTSNWSMPVFIFMPILLVSLMPRWVANKRWWTGPAFVLVFCALVLSLSPVIRAFAISEARRNAVLPISEIVATAESIWNEEAGTRLAYVGGDSVLSYGASFYASSRPYSIDGIDFGDRSWIDADTLGRKGFMVICFQDACIQQMETASDIDVSRTFVVPAIAGAGGASAYRVSLFMHLPGA